MAKLTDGVPVEVADKISAKAVTKAQAAAYLDAKHADKAKVAKAKAKGTVVEMLCEAHDVTAAQYAAGKRTP